MYGTIVNYHLLPRKVHSSTISFFGIKQMLWGTICDETSERLARLGSPPSIFTTNSSESVKAALKWKVDFKESEWPAFNKHVEPFVESQRNEHFQVTVSIIFCLNFSTWVFPPRTGEKMRPDQRQKVVADFDQATLAVSMRTPTINNTRALSNYSTWHSELQQGNHHRAQCECRGFWRWSYPARHIEWDVRESCSTVVQSQCYYNGSGWWQESAYDFIVQFCYPSFGMKQKWRPVHLWWQLPSFEICWDLQSYSGMCGG